MKILELCHYSAGVCGVWQRVKQESILLAQRGHEVLVISSNATKGSDEIASEKENNDGVKIIRKTFKKIGGESFMLWDFESDALEFHPDVIIAHSYRQPHTLKALKIAKKINSKVFLVTHAPFDRESTHSFLANAFISFYDLFIAPKKLKQFNKIIAITKWEYPYLHKLGLNDSNIEYIPNGIPEEFFLFENTQKEENKILFLGRIVPIKSLETVIESLHLLKDKKTIFEIVGPVEIDYLQNLKSVIDKNKVIDRVIFSPAIFDIKEKIKKIDSAKIFILPSISEGMPQGLIEGMARRKIIISSDNIGSKDLIYDKKNGYLFPVQDYKTLAELINSLSLNQKDIKKEAIESVKKFSWEKVIEKIDSLIKN